MRYALHPSEIATPYVLDTPDFSPELNGVSQVEPRLPQRFLGSRTGRAAMGLAVATGLVAGSVASEAIPATADAGVVHEIYRTGGDGLWLHSDGQPTIAGQKGELMPDGTAFNVECWKAGDPVNGNPVWLYGTDMTTGNKGAAADYYIDTHWKTTPDLKAQGMPECGTAEAVVQPPETPYQDPYFDSRSVFYSPVDLESGVSAAKKAADIAWPIKSWASGDCTTHKAVLLPDGINTLAGWSAGRLGAIYFLESASPRQIADIHNIVLFDPGATSDMDSCDQKHDTNGLLSSWLSSNSSNRLTVVTGKDTEMKDDSGHSTYAALWKTYLAGIWNQDFTDRAMICDYNDMAHQDTLGKFAWMIKNMPDKCPNSADVQHPLTQWHP